MLRGSGFCTEMTRKKAEAVEWAQLRMEGQALLVSSALGPSQLFWVACRTSPFLVQVFGDGKLLSIWRFPEEPVHLLLGPAPENNLKEETTGSLVVITDGGGVWQIPLASSTCSTQRPFKKQKEDERPVVPGTSNTSEWSIFEDIDMYEEPIHISPEVSQGGSIAKAKADGSSTSLQIKLKHLCVSTSRNNSRAINVTTIYSENLLGVIPGASIATFGSEGSVVISTTSGSLEILQMGARQHKRFPTSNKGRPVCLLFASLLDEKCSVMSNGEVALLQSKLFGLFLCKSGGQSYKHVLLEGYMDGKVYATPIDSLEPMTLSAVLIADIQQPIVALLSGQLNQTGFPHSNLQAGDVLVIIGQNGRVLALSAIEDMVATEANPFLHSRRFSKALDAGLHRLELEGMDLRDWKIKAPVISACMLGSRGLCYCAGSEVFVATLFDNAGSRKVQLQEVSSSKVAIRTLRESLEPRQVPLADVIVNVAGKGSPGRSLVALTARGRLLTVDVSDHSLLPAERDGPDNGDYCRTWSTPKATMEETIKELLESISDSAKSSELIQRDERAISFAIHEMAAALRLAFDVASKDKVVQQVTNRLHTTSGLQCTLSAAYCPPPLVSAEKLSFGSNTNPELIPCNSSFGCTRFTITLYNHSGSPVSAYWSILLELRSILHSKPVAQFSSIINNGCGLPVDGRCSLEFEIRSCETWEPVLASVYLCHVHDFHEVAVSTGLQEPSGSDAETLKTLQMSGASIALLAQFRVDILSLLRLPEKLYNPRFQMPGAACESEVAGVFGAFSGCLDVKTAEDFKCENAEHWRKLNMEHLLEKGSISKDGRELRFCAPDGGSVCISCSNGAGSSIRVHFQSSSLLLGCLVREALLNHMNQNGIHVFAGSDFTGFEEIRRKVENIAGQMGSLTEACNQLSSDNMASLLSDSWKLTEDLLRCYTAARTNLTSS